MSALFQWADVFVLPSIVEGSATVTYEALMSGVPVICTPNTGSIVEDGVNGVIIPTRSANALTEAIQRYMENSFLLRKHITGTVRAVNQASIVRYRTDINKLICSMETCYDGGGVRCGLQK
jgi:glycosyltransferase involved in cell wall biosynthesis